MSGNEHYRTPVNQIEYFALQWITIVIKSTEHGRHRGYKPSFESQGFFEGCVLHIFASLFFKSKPEYLSN